MAKRAEPPPMPSNGKNSAYMRLIEAIFLERYQPGMVRIEFARSDITKAASELKIALPKNLGDLIYTFRYRRELPQAVLKRCPSGKVWIIRPTGAAKYAFELTKPALSNIQPNPSLVQVKVPNATPGIIEMYALSDEQALLAKLRYNRLIDIFTGLTCYQLQSHLRTTVPKIGQVETDDLYVGLDRRGCQYVIPVQAKAGRDRLSVIQIEQDFRLCAVKFPDLICLPVAAQFLHSDTIALFSFAHGNGSLQDEVAVASERHYHLVEPGELSPQELRAYCTREPTGGAV